MGELLKKADLEARVSKLTLQRILDDDSNGNANTKAVSSIISSAEAMVWGAIGRAYDTDAIVTIVNLNSPSTEQARSIEILKTLALDVFEARLYRRHNEFDRQDGAELELIAMKEIKMLADAVTTLPGMPKAANVGADNFPDDTKLEAPRVFFHQSTGNF